MMKKLITLFLTLLLFGIVAVNAIDFPMVTYGFVEFDGVKYANQKVKIHSDYLNYDWEVHTNINGQYTITFNNLRDNLGNKVRDGDKVKVDACPFEVNPDCRKEVTVSTEPKEVSWGIDDGNAQNLISDDAVDIDDVTTITPDDTEVIIPQKCGDCSVVCPTCPDSTKCPDVSCPTQKVCEECDDCDNGWLYNIMFSIAFLVLGGFGWFSGFKGLIGYRVKKAKAADEAGDKKEAKKQYDIAARMLHTAVKNAKDGKYD